MSPAPFVPNPERLEIEEAVAALRMDSLGAAEIRESIQNRYAYATLKDQHYERVAGYGPVLDLGAGTGYHTYRLRARGADVIPVEPHFQSKDWTWVNDMVVQDHTATAQYADRTLFMCWPTAADLWSTHAVAAYGAAGGWHVVYVGDPQFEWTAHPDMPEALSRAGFVLVESCPVLSWPTMFTDYMLTYERQDV